VFFNSEHQKTALEMARKSIVLLENKNKILPLNKNKFKKILVMGSNADTHAIFGDWAFPQPKENYVTVLQGLKNIAPETNFDFLDLGWNIRQMDKDKVARAGSRRRKLNCTRTILFPEEENRIVHAQFNFEERKTKYSLGNADDADFHRENK
jgi:beta-glucosidase